VDIKSLASCNAQTQLLIHKLDQAAVTCDSLIVLGNSDDQFTFSIPHENVLVLLQNVTELINESLGIIATKKLDS
jgi:hypothetical protein